MRIGIDARLYGPKQGGLGRYLSELISALEKLQLNADFVIFLRKENWGEYQPQASNFSKVLADIPWYGIGEQLFLSNIFKKSKIDLMHFPHWNVPLFYNRPFIVTIHDLLLLHYPTREASTLGPLSYTFKQLLFKMVLNHAAKKCRHLITISEFSKKDIIKTLTVESKKVTVTYPAPFTSALIKIRGSEELFSSLKITKPYVLYVGVAYPHKNLDRLLEAWKVYQAKNGTDEQLVLAGKENFFYRRLRHKYSLLFAEKRVVFTDFVKDPDLAILYQKAKLFVFPSLYEGFGIPPLEAMRSGVPVIAADSSCLPEVLQDAAFYFNPKNTIEIAAAFATGLHDEKNRQKFQTLGYKLYPRYNWENTAKKTWEIYKNSV